MTVLWFPTPKYIKTFKLLAQLVACHEFKSTNDPTFTSDFFTLLDRLQNQSADIIGTTFAGELIASPLFTDLLLVDDLYKYLTAKVNLVSPTIVTGNVTFAVSIQEFYPLNTGTNTLMSLTGSAIGTNNHVNLSLGKAYSTNNSVEFRWYNSSPSYGQIALHGSTNGPKIYDTYTNIVPQLQIRNVVTNPVLNTTTTTVNSGNPTAAITWSATNVNRVDVNFIGMTKGTARSNIFIQCGQGTNFMTTAGDYSGVSMGNYDYELSPPGVVLSTTANGIALFSDAAEIGFVFSGTVTFVRVGNVTGKGELWSCYLMVYGQHTGSIPYSYTMGFGYVQMNATYPTFNSIRFNCFSGNWTAGTIMVTYV
jgi:hypothetical protein